MNHDLRAHISPSRDRRLVIVAVGFEVIFRQSSPIKDSYDHRFIPNRRMLLRSSSTAMISTWGIAKRGILLFCCFGGPARSQRGFNADDLCGFCLPVSITEWSAAGKAVSGSRLVSGVQPPVRVKICDCTLIRVPQLRFLSSLQDEYSSCSITGGAPVGDRRLLSDILSG